MNGFTKFATKSTDPRFPSFQQGFNKRWFAGSCKAVYVCYDAAGTVAALEEAIGLYGRNVKIKSGGHCYENFVFNNETAAIIDVSAMDGYGHDAEKGYYLDAGGTNWSAFNGLFRDYGKVLPAGSCYSVGLGGHICGGGYGLLSRLNGLTVDWLTGVDLVVKDNANQPASLRYVSADSPNKDEQDLFWGHLGGGGGNFGVITRYYFKELPDSPVSAFITQLSISWKDINPTVLGLLLDFFADLASDKNNWRQFGIFALHHISQGTIVMTIQTAVLVNEDPLHIRAKHVDHLLDKIGGIAPYQLTTSVSMGSLGGFIQPTLHTIAYTFYEAVQTLNQSGPNQRGKYKSAYMRKGFPQDQVNTIFDYLTMSQPSDIDMSQCLLQVDTYGGKINAVLPNATAIPQRSSILKLQYQAYWAKEEEDHIYLKWIRDFYKAMYAAMEGTPNPALDPTDNVDGCYYNYPDSDLNNHGGRIGALQLYFGENLYRLQQVKRRWDPNDYFNSAQSIPVA